ncbi:MAG: EAL domain-containing protein [Deltaproteobacteria bacterium]|nr:EAL domain-containing protein [Deltaproteobacteria bacterium]
MVSEASAAQFRQVIARREFKVAFQPVVYLNSGKIFSYEVLLRSGTPLYRGPIEMLAGALDCGCMGEFGRQIRELALAQSPETTLFVNLHPAELDEGWLVRPDDPIFRHVEGVYIEITESVPLTHFQLCHSILREVRSKGINLAVDDLGAGYSNLKYIADLSPEVVKIDRELVVGLDQSERQRKLVKAIVRLCADLGALVVAEGIETVDELRAVIDTGAHFGQGFLLARPAYPAPAVTWPPEVALA